MRKGFKKVFLADLQGNFMSLWRFLFLGGYPMATEGFKRKLTAIFSADFAGYSRLMGEDDELRIRTITDNRKIISALFRQYGGRVIDSPVDNMLAEFAKDGVPPDRG